MTAQASEGEPVFRTAAQLRDERRGLAARAAGLVVDTEERRPAPSPADLVVSPVIGLDQAKRSGNTCLLFRDAILRDPACCDEIDGTREMNRTGASRLAVPLGLSMVYRGI